ncbi:hypothetical protein Tco_1416349 [Tanacetum coccineum]
MFASNQQTLAKSGASERPPMLEKGRYVPWASHFMRHQSDEFLFFKEYPMISTILSMLVKLLNKYGNGSKEGESLSFVYERLTTLVNVMEQNNIHPLSISINTKFLNSLQPEWSKYVTMTRQIANIKETEFDNLFDTLIQYEPHVIASRAKKAARNHDPLGLVAHLNVHSLHSHVSPSYSHSLQPYYVTHPSSVIDYEEDYQREKQGDAQEDKLTTAMMLLARAITQCYSTLTNNRLRTSSNTWNQAVIQDGRVDIQRKNVGYAGNGNGTQGNQIEIKFLLQGMGCITTRNFH